MTSILWKAYHDAGLTCGTVDFLSLYSVVCN